MIKWFMKGINIIMRHALDIFGDQMSENFLSKIIHNHFNYFYEPIPISFLGREGIVDFNWRMTRDVGMKDGGVFDFNFLGEFCGHGHQTLSRLPEP